MDYEEMILSMQEDLYDGLCNVDDCEEDHYNPVIMRMLAERGD